MKTSDLVRVAKDFYIRSTKVAAKAAIFYAFPFMTTPPLDKFVDFVLGKVIPKTADLLELAGFYKYTDMRVDREGRDFAEAIWNKEKATTPEEKKIAEEKAIDAFRVFAKFIHVG